MTDEERNEQEERSEEERDDDGDSGEETSAESGDDTSAESSGDDDSGDDSGDEDSGEGDSGEETTAESGDDSGDDDDSGDEDSGDDDDSGKTVSDVMTSDPVAVEPGTSVEEAAQKMKEADAGAVLVVDDGELKGIATDRDITVDAVAEGEGSDAKIEDVMTSDPATLSPDDDIEKAIEAMRDQKVRRLPVVDDGKPVGVVSIGDLAAEADDSSVLGEMATAEANN